jgi:hypothetical protein
MLLLPTERNQNGADSQSIDNCYDQLRTLGVRNDEPNDSASDHLLMAVQSPIVYIGLWAMSRRVGQTLEDGFYPQNLTERSLKSLVVDPRGTILGDMVRVKPLFLRYQWIPQNRILGVCAHMTRMDRVLRIV